MAEEHFRKLERMYGRAPCNRDLSATVTIGEGLAEVRMPVREALFHAAGAVHGAYYFKLLDDAAFFAANSIVEGVFVLTVSFNVQLLRPISSGTLISRGTLVRSSKRGGPHCLDSAAAELRWTLRFIVRLPKSVAGSPHRRRSG